jgi:hypothetical protein
VLQRQRIAHLERQLSKARSAAVRRRGLHSCQEALQAALEKVMALQRSLDRCACHISFAAQGGAVAGCRSCILRIAAALSWCHAGWLRRITV